MNAPAMQHSAKNIKDNIFAPDKVLNILIFTTYLRHHIHELQTFKNGLDAY